MPFPWALVPSEHKMSQLELEPSSPTSPHIFSALEHDGDTKINLKYLVIQ